MSEIVGVCLSQFHDDENSFELLLAYADGREVGHLVSRPNAQRIAQEFANEFPAVLAEQTQQGVEVKKLEWEERGDSSHCAPSHIGHYHIFPGTGFSYDLCGPVGGRLATFKRLEAAKAAAQSDYETRIRSALVDVPAVESEQEEAGWQARYWIKSENRWSNWITNPRGHSWAYDEERIASGITQTRKLYAHPPRLLSNEAWMTVPADLVMRCEEALSWRRTGILQDGGALRQLANRIRNQFGGALLEDEAITHAEEKTEREAMQLVVALSTRNGSAGDGAATGTKVGDHA